MEQDLQVAEAAQETQEAAIETPEAQEEQAETLTKQELQERLNAVAKREREKAERKHNREKAELHSRLEALESKKAEPAKQEGRPTLDQFESYDDYTEALADWKYDQRSKADKAEQEKSKAVEREKGLQKSFASKVEKFKESTPDFDDVVSEISDIALTPSVIEALFESDISAELTYYFGKNPDDLERINSLSAISAAREIGKIEAKLSTAEVKKTSNAPEPAKPLSTRSSESSLSDNLSAEEWIKRRNAQVRKK